LAGDLDHATRPVRIRDVKVEALRELREVLGSGVDLRDPRTRKQQQIRGPELGHGVVMNEVQVVADRDRDARAGNLDHWRPLGARRRPRLGEPRVALAVHERQIATRIEAGHRIVECGTFA